MGEHVGKKREAGQHEGNVRRSEQATAEIVVNASGLFLQSLDFEGC